MQCANSFDQHDSDACWAMIPTIYQMVVLVTDFKLKLCVSSFIHWTLRFASHPEHERRNCFPHMVIKQASGIMKLNVNVSTRYSPVQSCKGLCHCNARLCTAQQLLLLYFTLVFYFLWLFFLSKCVADSILLHIICCSMQTFVHEA